MKNLKVQYALWVSLAVTVSASVSASESPTLTISTYDSLAAEGGWGAAIIPLFEKKCACKVRVLAAGDAGQIVTRLRLDAERGKPGAEVVLGIDQNLWAQARDQVEAWGDWRPRDFAKVLKDVRVGRDGEGFLPFDHGVFAFMADTEKLKALGLPVPKRLDDLLDPRWRRNVILEDPRTSTPGLAFVLWVNQVKGVDFWSRLRTQWLTLAPGWDAAYGLFLKGEAPLVWSYTTSQAYHAEHGDTAGRYRALVFEEGQPLQIEGAALVKGAFKDAAARERARAFLEFLISPEAQALVPTKNWMLPVRAIPALPKSFQDLPQAKRRIRIDASAKDIEAQLTKWSHAIRENKAP